MKLLPAVVALWIALAVMGCGDGETYPSAAEADGYFASVSGGEWDRAPEVLPPDRLPPKKVVFRDIEVGGGPMARRGDRVAIHYVGINYKTGETQYPGRWPPEDPLILRLGSGYVALAYEEALVGMRVGGRREVIVPSRLLFRTGTIDYVVDLVRIEPASKANREGG